MSWVWVPPKSFYRRNQLETDKYASFLLQSGIVKLSHGVFPKYKPH